jgi:hypothetical protein
MTLEKIRAALPTHIMLTPGVHIYRDGDEWIDGNLEWCAIHPENVGRIINSTFQPIVRRKIPPHILDNQTFWVMYNSMATLNGRCDGWLIYLTPFQTDEGYWVAKTNIDKTDRNYGIRKFSSKEKAIEFDNAVMHMKDYYAHMDGQRYDKWLLEQMEDV